MFKHQGPSRSVRQNAVLAAYLAFVGGFVNASGFILIGSFTSHVTGNVGRLANELALRHTGAATAAGTMIGAFFVGAFAASAMVESDAFGTVANAYGAALLGEAVLLTGFAAAFAGPVGGHLGHDFEGAFLCAAMGMQNSLVTRISGAVVRTTHLTGVVTDLGIECAHWFRWWRDRASEAWGIRLAVGRVRRERPSQTRIGLLATIAGSFLVGAVGGAAGATGLGELAMALPIVCLVVGAAYALRTARQAAH